LGSARSQPVHSADAQWDEIARPHDAVLVRCVGQNSVGEDLRRKPLAFGDSLDLDRHRIDGVNEVPDVRARRYGARKLAGISNEALPSAEPQHGERKRRCQEKRGRQKQREKEIVIVDHGCLVIPDEIGSITSYG
jgi:hypothetical protein